MSKDEILVFDTGPLSHFPRQGWLGVLKAMVGGRIALIPDVVVHELHVGSSADSRIQSVLDAAWIERRELRSDEEIVVFARFSALLVKGERNRGEAGVLALASTINGIAVIDDAAGRKAVETHKIQLRAVLLADALRLTLALLCQAIREGLLTVRLVSALADDLLADDYRLPFVQGEFSRWARGNGNLE